MLKMASRPGVTRIVSCVFLESRCDIPGLLTSKAKPDRAYGFGIWIVLLTMKQPLKTNRPTIGWNSKGVPFAATPRGMLCSTHPCETQYAISAAIDSVVGIGVPSKYCDFPVLSLGKAATVTLNLARRVRPQRTKKVRRR